MAMKEIVHVVITLTWKSRCDSCIVIIILNHFEYSKKKKKDLPSVTKFKLISV